MEKYCYQKNKSLIKRHYIRIICVQDIKVQRDRKKTKNKVIFNNGSTYYSQLLSKKIFSQHLPREACSSSLIRISID